MKYSNLQKGSRYKTKIGANWKDVTLVNKRELFNLGKTDRDKLVIVRTPAGNNIYRSSGQLRKPQK